MIHAANFFLNFFHYFYIPSTGPWYAGNVWGNVFVIVVAAPLGWIWSKTKYWPLHPLHNKIDSILLHHKEQKAHNMWMATHIDKLHRAAFGVPAAPHPHFTEQQLGHREPVQYP